MKGETIKTIMRFIVTSILVIFAIYVFFLMISTIDFSGMSFFDAKLIISVCAGVAVSIVSATKGVSIIYSALSGFVCGAILHALILTAIELI